MYVTFSYTDYLQYELIISLITIVKLKMRLKRLALKFNIGVHNSTAGSVAFLIVISGGLMSGVIDSLGNNRI